MNFAQSSKAALAQQRANAKPPAPAVPNPYGTLYVLRGVVGCGKTTYANELCRFANLQGRFCVAESTDKYILRGMSVNQANAALAQALREIQRKTASNKIVVLETCSATFDSHNVVGVNFSRWRVIEIWVNLNRRLLQQYLAWTLRNVVQRSNALLCVSRSTLPICIRTHSAKARAIFGITQALAVETCPLSNLLQTLKPAADEYQAYLQAHKEQFAPKLLQ
jgi:predicted RNA-binding protein YlxR (DUF448 family)